MTRIRSYCTNAASQARKRRENGRLRAARAARKLARLDSQRTEFLATGRQISFQYMAGMIDGEGCIGTTRTGRCRGTVGRLTIANTDHQFLILLKSEFGGTLRLNDRGTKIGWRAYGSITWSNRQALLILEAVLPFLLIKKRQAELCIELIRMRDAAKNERYEYRRRAPAGAPPTLGSHPGGLVLRPEVIEQETRLAAAIRSLNRKGP